VLAAIAVSAAASRHNVAGIIAYTVARIHARKSGQSVPGRHGRPSEQRALEYLLVYSKQQRILATSSSKV